MRSIEGKVFRQIQKYPWRRTIKDRIFQRCDFYGCKLFFQKYPILRAKIRNIHVHDCEVYGTSQLCSAILENIVVDGLKVRDPDFFCGGCVFKHVVLKGKIGGISIAPYQNERYDLANKRYYQNVDWALDISQADFRSTFTVEGIPVHLIRRDPESQVIVRRESLLDERFRDVPLEGVYIISLANFFRSQQPEMVLIAPKRHRDYKSYLEDFVVLQKAGIVEGD